MDLAYGPNIRGFPGRGQGVPDKTQGSGAEGPWRCRASVSRSLFLAATVDPERLCGADDSERLRRLWCRAGHSGLAYHRGGIFQRSCAPSAGAEPGASPCWCRRFWNLRTEEQKKKWRLKPTLRGEVVWCRGYSEAGFRIQTFARPSGPRRLKMATISSSTARRYGPAPRTRRT